MNIYEITQNLQDIYNEIEAQEGEITEEIAARLEVAEADLESKAGDYAAFIRNLKAEAEALKAESDRLTKRRRAVENLQQRLKDALAVTMTATGKDKLKSGIFSLSLRKSEAVEILDEAAVPDTYCTFERKVSKSQIKEAISNGEDVAGARIVENVSLQLR